MTLAGDAARASWRKFLTGSAEPQRRERRWSLARGLTWRAGARFADKI